jgi:hypothetical protein
MMNLKAILPIEKYTLETKLTPGQVYERISRNTSPAGFFRRDSGEGLFRGKVSPESFTISRVINYRNSFIPEISGEVTTFLGKTQVNIRMRPFISVLVFMCFWLGGVALGCVMMLISGIGARDSSSFFTLIPFAMFIFGSLLFVSAFRYEVGKAKKLLAELLEAEQP